MRRQTITRLERAHALVLIGPALLLGGALLSQHAFGLPPCELCFWQRWPHLGAILIGLMGLTATGISRRAAVLFAAVAVAVSGIVGVFHAGVEQNLWRSPFGCTAVDIGTSGDFLRDMMAAPVVRCDVAAWDLFGISLAGYNAIFSLLIAGGALWLSLRPLKPR